MTELDVAGMFSAFLVLLAIAGVLADWAYAETRTSRRYQARRIR